VNIFFWRTKPEFKEVPEVDHIGYCLDTALETYSELLDNSCRDSVIMDAAW
jgi:hypothetical protein